MIRSFVVRLQTYPPGLNESTEVVRVQGEPPGGWAIVVQGPDTGRVECEWGTDDATVTATNIPTPTTFVVHGTDVRVRVTYATSLDTFIGVVSPTEAAPTLLPDATG